MTEPLAIVGMSCRLPGADGLDEFWRLLVEGRTAWGPLPATRLDRDLYFAPEKGTTGRTYSDIGGLVPDRPVDPRRCPLTDDLLRRYDVAHHLFLEVAAQACHDAGLDPFAMPVDRSTGVYVGHTGGSTRIGDIVYASGIAAGAGILADVEAARLVLGDEVHAVAAEIAAGIRGRYPPRVPGERLHLDALGAAAIVHEALAVRGPYLVVDAACASSLQALAIAARALLAGSIDQAIVGGASYCKSDSLVLFSAAQSVSATGSCPFGEDADGLVTAEGYVAIVLKTLARAEADGDRVRAVIRGLGVASDGKGKSLWAPRQEGQIAAVQRAYPDPADLGRLEYIETHATGTQVGDATELAALGRVMADRVPAGRKLPIGSVKATIGHTLETAGLASLVKVVLALEHGMIPPGSTRGELSRSFDWDRGPFVVPRTSLPWPAHADGSPRLAAVNAFGIGGLNVHLAIAEHLPAPPRRPGGPRPRRDADHDAIAIIGAGCVLPGSLTRAAFFARLDSGETAIGPVPADRWDSSQVLDPSGPRPWHVVADVGGFVRDFAYDWRRHRVPPKQIAAANPLQFMLLEAADEAVRDAGGPEAIDRRRTAVVVGTRFGGDFSHQLQMGLRLPETVRLLGAALRRRGVAPADHARIVAAYETAVLDRMPALIDETGSFTSSTLASRLTKTFDLMGGAVAIDAGDCSSMAAIAAAVDMLRSGDCDTVLCAAGDRCLDVMAYEGLSLAGHLASRPTSVLDGLSSGGTVPAEGAVVFVLRRLADARATGARIHGVIRGVGLAGEAAPAAAVTRAIAAAHRDAGIGPDLVRAVTVATAGGLDTSGAGLDALGAAYGGNATPPVAGAIDGLIGHAGAAAGAAGLLALTRALDVGRLPATAALATQRRDLHGMQVAAEPLPIGAQDAAPYRAGGVTVAHASQAGHVVIDNAAAVPRSPAAPLPGVVIPTPFPVSADRPLVAALFPGQGSQYADMFRDLADLPAGAAAIAAVDEAAREAGHATLADIAWHEPSGLGLRVWDTQWSVLLADLVAWRTLQQLGFAPDIVASHSFGEFPALVAGGAWSLAAAARATRARADAVEQFGPRDGAMLSVIADRSAVDEVLGGFRDRVWICAENAPEQFVVGGRSGDVDAVESLLEARGVKSKRIAVPSPFHTPLLAAAADRLATVIDTLPIEPPRVPTFGSTTAALLGDAAAIRASLVAQMTQPVRWIDTVLRLHERGVRTFVEVGPSGVLTGLTRRILAGREGVRFVQFDQRGRSSRGDTLQRLAAQLAAAGAVRPVVAARPAAAAAASRPTVFDATARRRDRNRAAAAVGSGRAVGLGSPAAAPPPDAPKRTPPAEASTATAELQTFLVDFVVEQTGYPHEIVELDADLEADLGIDSIRKAQMVGEIGLRYGLTADDDVALDAFPTLRHLLDYLLPRVGHERAGQTSGRMLPAPVSAQGSAQRPPRVASEQAVAPPELDRVALPADATWERLVVAPVAGSAPSGLASPTPRGLVVCFGRHATPVARRFTSGGLSGSLVGLPGLAGAVAGWNDAGLAVLGACRAGPANAGDAAMTQLVERIATGCRTVAVAGDAVRDAGPTARGLVVADLASGGVHQADADGRLVALGSTFDDALPPSPLASLLLDDGMRAPETALGELLATGRPAAGRMSALSTTCVWFTVGIGADGPVTRSGGPLTADWLGDAASASIVATHSSSGTPLDRPSNAVTRRYRLEAVDRAAARVTRSLVGAGVLLLGDDSLATPLAAALAAAGARPVTAAGGTAAAAVAAVDEAERAGPIEHLVLLPARPAQDDAAPWTERRERVLAAAYFACQRWIGGRIAADGLAGSTLTALVDLGGDFGLSGRLPAADGGGLAGLCKALAREFSRLHVRVVDAPAALAAPTAAAAIVAEMIDGAGPVETGLLAHADGPQGVRRVTVAPREACLPDEHRPQAALDRGSVWLVTGGARGVTAACALALGMRHGLSLVLVGSTRPVAVDPAWIGLDEAGRRLVMADVMRRARERGDDPLDAWRIVEKSIEIEGSLERCTRSGVAARYMACDLADAEQVRRLVDAVAVDVGPIRGIVHGAGQESACRFERKSRAGYEATLGPKCLGLEHLMAAVEPRSLGCVVGFGSTSGRLGGLGQADYSLANDLLAKSIAAWRGRRQGLLAATFHWHAWGEVGMAHRPESRLALERLGLQFMPLAEGVDRFVAEIEAGLPDAEVLVTEPAMCPDALPPAATPAPTATTPAPTDADGDARAASADDSVTGSLVDRVEPRADAVDVLFRLDPGSDRFLLEHLLAGRPLLPAVMGLELVAQAARAGGAERADEIRDFVVERPLEFPDAAPRIVRAAVNRTGDGIRVQALARPVSGLDRTVEWVHFRAAVPNAPGERIVADVGAPAFPFNPMVYPDDAPLVHGPSFRTLQDLSFDRTGGWGRLVAPAGAGVALPRGRHGWTVPVELLDGCLVACAVYSYLLCGRRVELPVRVERLRIAARPAAGELCRLRLLIRAQSPAESVYDFVVVGADERPILAVDGLHLAIVSGEEKP